MLLAESRWGYWHVNICLSWLNGYGPLVLSFEIWLIMQRVIKSKFGLHQCGEHSKISISSKYKIPKGYIQSLCFFFPLNHIKRGWWLLFSFLGGHLNWQYSSSFSFSSTIKLVPNSSFSHLCFFWIDRWFLFLECLFSEILMAGKLLTWLLCLSFSSLLLSQIWPLASLGIFSCKFYLRFLIHNLASHNHVLISICRRFLLLLR